MIVALDEALNRLGKLDDRKVRVVEMKFFAGLNVSEIDRVERHLNRTSTVLVS